MATNQRSTATNIPAGAADIASEVQSAFVSADKQAAQRVQNLQLVHQARTARLTRELATLKREHAPDDDVAAAEAAVAASKFTASRVGVVHQQVTTAQPQVAAQGWALHGRVFDSNLQPLSGFTVFLVDGQKTYQKEYGFAYTDDTGYFLINYPGPSSANATTPKPSAASQSSSAEKSGATTVQTFAGIPTAAGTTPSGSASTSGAATPASASQTSQGPQLFLEVADTKAYPVYLGNTAFQPVTGSATYQNLTLAPGNKPIGDPPQQIREIAIPPSRKKKSPTKRRK